MLPELKKPTYEIKLVSIDQPVKFRPFVSKEEKVLLMAKESKDYKQIKTAIHDIIAGCTFGVVDSNTLPTFDIEMMFLNLRARSVSEVASITMECTNKIQKTIDNPEIPGEGQITEETSCGNKIVFDINLPDIKIVVDPNHTRKIILDEAEQIGIMFRYPNIATSESIKDVSKYDVAEYLTPLVESIFDRNAVYHAKDIPMETIKAYFDDMTRENITKIKEQFLDTMPSLQYTHKYKCQKCGYEGSYTFKGLNDFF